ncbi:MAG: M13 family metallopeptidase [Bacteroidota bacterium]|nr:M13 family metallopeptidase [Bacteroidota bacterium]
MIRSIVLFVCFLALATAQSKQTPAIDTANIDPSVKPCDDFNRYANGRWLKNNPIPAEYSSWGSFNELTEKNNVVLKKILEAAAKNSSAKKGTPEQKIGDIYATGMDSVTIEKLGYEPIKKDLARIAALKTYDDVQKEIAYLQTIGARSAFGFSSGQDEKDSKSVIAQFSQGGLGLPDRDYYLADDAKSKSIREEYARYMTTMQTLIGDNEATAKANTERVVAVETRLAKASYTRVERRDPEKNYNKMDQKKLSELAPNINWKKYFTAIGADNVSAIDVGQPPFFKELSAMMKDVSIDDWKLYLRWKLLSGSASSLSSPFVAEQFRFGGTVLTGAKEMQPRWKRVLAVINRTMGEALGKLYVDETFPPDAKQKAKAMVNNLIAAFRVHIDALDWMDDATRKAALHKLESFTVKIGYPDKWEDYTKLNIDRQSYFDNLRRANQFAFDKDVDDIGKPVDRLKWGMSPQTVNAYYNPNMNEIVFPAAILQPPFFDPNADEAVNYGGMGAVIGHELTHGFDDQGSKYDAEGNLKEWWTPETRKRFDERTAIVEHQFDSYVAIDSLHVNGKLTLGENIADLGGLTIAYSALEKVLSQKPNLHTIDGLTPPQRFFLSWAQVWRRNSRDEALRLQVRTDPHSPGMFRANGPISNMPDFYRAFECAGSGKLFRGESERAKIW